MKEILQGLQVVEPGLQTDEGYVICASGSGELAFVGDGNGRRGVCFFTNKEVAERAMRPVLGLDGGIHEVKKMTTGDLIEMGQTHVCVNYITDCLPRIIPISG
jgi:hypothetical protein